MADRAAQFAPYAALTGYDAVIRETGRLTDARIEPDEEALTALANADGRIAEAIADGRAGRRAGDHPARLPAGRAKSRRRIPDRDGQDQEGGRIRAPDDPAGRDENPDGRYSGYDGGAVFAARITPSDYPCLQKKKNETGAKQKRFEEISKKG